MNDGGPPEQPVNQFGTPLGPPVNEFGTPIWPAPGPAGSFAITPADPYAPPFLGLVASRPNPARRKALIAGGLAIVLLTVVGVDYARIAHPQGRIGRSAPPFAAGAGAKAPSGLPSADPDGGPSQTPPGVLPPALSAVEPATSPSVITLPGAQRVLAGMWPVREQILATRDAADLAGIEDGSALAGDRIRMECGCIRLTPLSDDATSQVFVARQPRYPAHFLAEVQTDDPDRPYMEFVAFSRASAKDHWRVSFDSGLLHLEPHNLDSGDTDPLGYLTEVPRAVRALAQQMPARLAAYYQRAKDSGVPGASAGFAPGPWTSRWVASSARNPNRRVLAGGLVVDTRYSTRAGQPIYVAPINGWTLACGVVSYHSVLRRPGALLVQDNARTAFRRSLAPGSYAELVEDGQLQTCFYLPASGHEPVIVNGGDLDSETVTRGVPAGPTT